MLLFDIYDSLTCFFIFLSNVDRALFSLKSGHLQRHFDIPDRSKWAAVGHQSQYAPHTGALHSVFSWPATSQNGIPSLQVT